MVGKPNLNLHDYSGVIHLHSAYSFDGSAPPAKIIAAANREKVDFLLLTDHGTLRARKEGWEGWHGRTLLIVGEEISPRFNHYLAFGHATPIPSDEDTPAQTIIERVSAAGGFGFIAHPDHEGAPLFHVKHYPWTDWTAEGYAGLGIWDFMTDWQKGLTGYLRALLCYAFPALFLKGPSARTLARWDDLAQVRPVVGIGELDNHATRQRLLGLTFTVFPFRRAFRLIRTHLLTETPLSGEAGRDIPLLLGALRRGRAYISLEYYCPATGLLMELREGKQGATMGDTFLLRRRAELSVVLPRPALIRLLRNGTPLKEEYAQQLSAAVEAPGVYRLEASLKRWGRFAPWIYTNPIYVKMAQMACP